MNDTRESGWRSNPPPHLAESTDEDCCSTHQSTPHADIDRATPQSVHLAPAGGLAAASAEAPAAGRVHLVLEPLLAALDALTQAADQALQAVGAGLRRALAWRPWPAAVDPGTPVEPAGGALSPPGPHPNSLCPHQHPPK